MDSPVELTDTPATPSRASRRLAWAPGAAFALAALAVFFGLRASGADQVATPAALFMVFAGALAMVALNRVDARAAAAMRACAEAEARAAAATEKADALRAERDRLARFIDGLPVGVCALDADGTLRYANATLARWLGAEAATLSAEGARIDDFLDPEDAPPSFAPEAEITVGRVVLRSRSGERLERIGYQSPGRAPDGASFTRLVLVDGAQGAPSSTTSEAELRQARYFDAAPIGIALIGLDGRVVECNQSFRAMIGEPGTDPIGEPLIDLVAPRDRDALAERLSSTTRGSDGASPIEVRLDRPREAIATLYAHPLEGEDGAVAGIIVHLIDVTEQKSLEAQFFQSQKMQAVGQLAGGIAHDFNNLLTAMMGFCDLLLMRHQAGDPSFGDIMQIKQNVNRAAGLVRQLLAFSRRQTLQPRVLVLTDVLAELSNLLRRLIGANIELKLIHARDLGSVKADQGQIEQVIINLAVNARDAMPDGGVLTIRTANVTSSETASVGPDLLPPGEYVLIEISDTGVGIPKENLGKIFDPFFTTKEVGAGTGLGLSTVYGIIKQTGGYIFVDSEPGQGARFSIFLPRHQPSAEEIEAAQGGTRRAPARDLTGKGTILLVEDEDSVRVFGARALRGKGYTVLEADSGEAALEVLKSHDGAIDLLITDVVMPQMDGPRLVEEVRAMRPSLKVIFISGYAEESFAEKLDGAEDVDFLPKPFSLTQLAAKVKETLKAGAG